MAEEQPAIRVILLPRDTNEAGTIFGGVILSHLDMAGAVEARKHANRRFVTVGMKEVTFKKPVFVGDVVSFYARTLKVGTTSVTVRVQAWVERRRDPSIRELVTEAEIAYVAIDDQWNPIPVHPPPKKGR